MKDAAYFNDKLDYARYGPSDSQTWTPVQNTLLEDLRNFLLKLDDPVGFREAYDEGYSDGLAEGKWEANGYE